MGDVRPDLSVGLNNQGVLAQVLLPIVVRHVFNGKQVVVESEFDVHAVLLSDPVDVALQLVLVVREGLHFDMGDGACSVFHDFYKFHYGTVLEAHWLLRSQAEELLRVFF